MNDSKRRIQDLVSLYYESEEGSSSDKLKSLGSSSTSIIQDISYMYQRECRENYEKLMKTVGSVKALRKTLQEYVLTQSSSKEKKGADTEYKPFQESIECFSCLQNSMKAYISYLATPTSIMNLAYGILKKDPQFIYKLLDLGLSSAVFDNSKRILGGVISFLMIAVHNNNSAILEEMAAKTEKDIYDAVKNNLRSLKEMRGIHYRVLLLIGLSRNIQKIVLTKEKKNESTELQIEAWRSITNRMEQIMVQALNCASENPILSEYILSPILKTFREHIKPLNIKQDTSKPILGKIEKLEEEKKEEEEEEEVKSPDAGEDKEDTEIKIELAEEPKESKDSASTQTFNRFGYKLIADALLPEEKFDKDLTKEKLRERIAKKVSSETHTVGNTWLRRCLTHASNKIMGIAYQIMKEITYEKSENLLGQFITFRCSTYL